MCIKFISLISIQFWIMTIATFICYLFVQANVEDAFLNTAKQIYANIQNGVIDVSNDVSTHIILLYFM